MASSPFDPTIEAALTPGEPGRLVKWLGGIVPGVGQTGQQISEYAAYWRIEALTVLGTPSVDRPLLIALGDSLAQGIGASTPELGYVGLAREHLAATRSAAVDVINLSRSGAVIADVIASQLPAVRAVQSVVAAPSTRRNTRRPIWYLCTIGNNDLMAGTRPKTVANRFDELLPQLPPSTIVATLPAAGSIGVKLLNRSLRESAYQHGIALADVGRLLQTWRGNTAGDRFHPNDAGYQIWAEAFITQTELEDSCSHN